MILLDSDSTNTVFCNDKYVDIFHKKHYILTQLKIQLQPKNI